MGDKRRDQRREQCAVGESSDLKHFNGKQGPGDRGAEHGGEARADSTDDESDSIDVLQANKFSECRAQRSADLRTGPDVACGASTCDRGDEFDGNHARMDFPTLLMNGTNHLFRAVPSSSEREFGRYDPGEREADRQEKKCIRE